MLALSSVICLRLITEAFKAKKNKEKKRKIITFNKIFQVCIAPLCPSSLPMKNKQCGLNKAQKALNSVVVGNVFGLVYFCAMFHTK